MGVKSRYQQKNIKALGTAIAWRTVVVKNIPVHLIVVYLEPGNRWNAEVYIPNLKGIV